FRRVLFRSKKAMADKYKWEVEARHYANTIEEFTGFVFTTNQPTANFLTILQQPETEVNEGTHPLLIEKDRQDKLLNIREKNLNHQVLPDVSILGGGMLRGTGFYEEGHAWSDSYALAVNNYLVGLGLTWDISKFYSKGLKKKRLIHQKIRLNEEREEVKRHLDQEKKSLAFKIDKA